MEEDEEGSAKDAEAKEVARPERRHDEMRERANARRVVVTRRARSQATSDRVRRREEEAKGKSVKRAA